MSDLISREAAIAEITSWIFTDEDLEGEGDEYQYFNRGLKRAIKALAKVPAVGAEPVRHGRWEHGMRCSGCGQVDVTKPNYCPNCGARMDLED